MVIHDCADDLRETLPHVTRELGARDALVIVDSGSSDDSAEAARETAPEATVIEAGSNVGFATGCNIAAREARTELILLLNPDAVPQPGCLDALRGAADRHPSWGAWQALVALDDHEHVNTAGNLVHWLGFGWSGGLDAPLSSVDPTERTVGFGSGAALVVRHDLWESVGGFDDRYFMYGEDLDVSLRLRLAGHEIGVVPSAVVTHGYSFTKGDYKWFHLERNRWWTILSDYPASVLALAAPGLLAFELGLLIVARRDGWLGPKLRSQRAVVRELPQILRRRRVVQRTRAISPRTFAQSLTTSLDSPHLGAATAIPGADAAQRAYWTAGMMLLR